jgi:4-hydroxybenzoate adenylyltransferase
MQQPDNTLEIMIDGNWCIRSGQTLSIFINELYKYRSLDLIVKIRVHSMAGAWIGTHRTGATSTFLILNNRAMLDSSEVTLGAVQQNSLRIFPDRTASVVVIGGGVAGTWVAYQLAKLNIDTVLVSFESADRGGIQGASRRSVGACNTMLLDGEDLEAYLQRIGQGQTHPSVAGALTKYLPRALAELEGLIELKPIKIGVALTSGGEGFLETMRGHFQDLGGEIMNAWVTRLSVDQQQCRGIQYETATGIGKIRCRAVVIASGGYAGLFANSIRTNCFGNILGSYLRCGGVATNLEFLFKHGYGNIDTNALTPTEELPGAEIYDSQHQRVRWLEELLFERQGTNTHLQAVHLWLRDPSTQFYVDLSYRGLYLKLSRLAAQLLNNENGSGGSGEAKISLDEVADLFPGSARPTARQLLVQQVCAQRRIDYQTFETLKPLLTVPDSMKFRVKPLTYFCMGGIGHVDFATNLKAVYVTGEAMHDFGANRVGGLPWSLYLASAYRIAEQIGNELARDRSRPADFELVANKSRFDSELLGEIQMRLHKAQECELNTLRANQCIAWLRRKRRELQVGTDAIHDGISWLLVAEAVMQCSLSRTESRGFFFRVDYRDQNQDLDHVYSCAWYDQASDQMKAGLWMWPEIAARFSNGASAQEQAVVYDDLG